MKRFYFVGGPRKGSEVAFLDELARMGGPPAGWRVYPHASGDGRALHVVDVEDETSITAHLERFGKEYEHGPIVEVTAR